ncbi:hypothetical protein H8356DRAFT_927792 [Neocallimastix lanati (nom. inval.)]|nr:hypothetical protein H8356DRAFT_927792 [Neocallimastix sp. JGI-2020a]
MIFTLKKKKWGLRNQFLDELRDADVLNKIDLPESGKNIENFCRKYDEASVLTSALSECFFRILDKQKFIKYYEGTEFFDLAEDQISNNTIIININYIKVDPSPEEKLKTLDYKLEEKVQDMLLFRYSNTGVVECIRKAVECLNVIPVFPVKNVNHFSSGRFGTKTVFSDCLLVPGGTTLGEDDIITLENNIICIKMSQVIQKKTNNY